MIREITGMLVTATARPNTSVSAVWLPRRSGEPVGSRVMNTSRPARKGTVTPRTVTSPTTRASSGRNAVRISAPEQNIRSRSPSW